MRYEFNPEKHSNPSSEYDLHDCGFYVSKQTVLIYGREKKDTISEFSLAKFYFIIRKENDINRILIFKRSPNSISMIHKSGGE